MKNVTQRKFNHAPLTDHWSTPKDVYDKLHDEFNFDLILAL